MRAFFFLLLLPCWGFASSSFEVDTLQDRHHVTADRTLYHSKEKVYEAFGHVVVSSDGQRLSADYLWFDTQTKDVRAKGNVLFVDKTTTIQAAELHFNYVSGVGAIFYGKVSNDLYSLKGQLIRKVSADRFLTTEGEYTTCKDCAESWKLSARNVDMTVDGYAFMDSVFIKIKDIPTLFFPYLIVPVKTRRQTGLLFPRISGSSSHGFVAVQPLFIAIDDHQDMTLGLGRYSSRGNRYEVQYRYKSFNGANGVFDFYRTNDRKISYASHRTAFKTTNEIPLSKRLQIRFRVYETLDRDYSLDFPEDIIGSGLPNLESNLVATTPFDDFFFSVEARRYRNLLYEQPVGFDGGVVQAVPTMHFGLKERRIFGPLLGGLYSRYDFFRRRNGSFFDSDRNKIFDEGQDTLREANRWIFQPEISSPFRIGNLLRLSPSLQFNEIRYDFSTQSSTGAPVADTQTRYLLAKLEASTVLERVYAYDGKSVSRLKHQLTPFLTFSNIPWIQRGAATHPFNGTAGQLNAESGLFDQYDIVPLTNDTNFLRYPQGKSVYYGFTSRLIRKLRGADDISPRAYPYDQVLAKSKKYPSPLNRKMELAIDREKQWDKYDPHYDQYQEVWTVNMSQAYDFKTARKYEQDKKRAFSYFLAKSDLKLDSFSHSLEYKFFPRIVSRTVTGTGASTATTEQVFSNKHSVSTSFTYFLKNLSNLRRTRSFVRSVTGSFSSISQPSPSRSVASEVNWSLNDFFGVKLHYEYDLLAKNQLNWSAQTVLTHHSECWGVLLRYDWLRSRTPRKSEVGFELLVNLLGTGWLGSSQSQEGGPAGVFGGK